MKQFKKHSLLFLSILMIGAIFFGIINVKGESSDGVLEVKGRVLDVDNSEVVKGGIASIGHQKVEVEVIEGRYKGEILKATNLLQGSLQWDYNYREGEKVIVAIKENAGGKLSVMVVDIYRQNWILILGIVFILALVLYAGIIGLKALFSFIASLYIIWNILVPGLLEGQNPLLLSGFVLVLLSAIIIFSIAGFSKKGMAAFFGTISSLFITIGITVFFGNRLSLEGMSAPYVGELLFGGYMDLNLKDIFYSAVIIGASGAAMDVAMDMAATIQEVKDKRPDSGIKELIKSGFNVGRAVIGTMTTTLLLAYTGGYLTLLMAFMSRGVTYRRMINLRIITSEILRTLTGSIGIVLVAPITTVFAAWIYCTDFRDVFFSQKAKSSDVELEVE